MNIGYLQCCGIRELGAIGPDLHRRDFKGIVAGARQAPAAMYLFSLAGYQQENGGLQSVDEFVAFIKENKLGVINQAAEGHNPNSGNNLKMWVWVPSSRNALLNYDRLPKPRAASTNPVAVQRRRAAALKGWATRRRREERADARFRRAISQ